MKIAFIFGKGIEGCGVTKGANIFEKWLVDHGHETIIINFYNAQSFGRANDISWKGHIFCVKQNQEIKDVQNIVDEVNSCKIAIVHSYPTYKNGKYIDRFREFVEKINDPILVVHDHAITKNTINRQTQVVELFSMADIGVTQSSEGYSQQCYKTADIGLEDRLIENPIWINAKEYDKYRTPFENREKHLLYVGRMSPIKDPAMICRIEPFLKNDWKLSLIGCERSISSIGDPNSKTLNIDPSPYHKSYQHKIKFISTNSKGQHYINPEEQKKTNTTITSYDKYKYDWGMIELGKSMASWCGYRLRDIKEYGRRMEYTTIESFLLSLPIISRHFAENGISPEGKRWGEYYGPMISEATKEEELAKELKCISNDSKEWKKRTEACQELIYRFNDIDSIAEKFLDFVISKGKKKNKVDFIKKISSYFPGAAKKRERGEILVSTPASVIAKKAYTLIDGKQVEVKLKVSSKMESLFNVL